MYWMDMTPSRLMSKPVKPGMSSGMPTCHQSCGNNSWEVLCVDLIGPCTPEAKTDQQLTSCVSTWLIMWAAGVKMCNCLWYKTPTITEGGNGIRAHNTQTKGPHLDKSSVQINSLVYKTWLSRYLHCQKNMTREASLNLTSIPYVRHMA